MHGRNPCAVVYYIMNKNVNDVTNINDEVRWVDHSYLYVLAVF